MSKIIYVCLVSCIFYTVNVECLSDEMIEMIKVLHNTCQTETGVAEAAIENARKGDFADDNSLKCYMKCLGIQLATVDDDGTVDVEATVAMIPAEFKDKAEPIIRKCGTQTGSDPCDTAFKTHKCYYEASPADYYLI